MFILNINPSANAQANTTVAFLLCKPQLVPWPQVLFSWEDIAQPACADGNSCARIL